VCLPFEDTTSLCSDSEDDSNLSDDFYSIVSEDDEVSLYLIYAAQDLISWTLRVPTERYYHCVTSLMYVGGFGKTLFSF